MKQYFLFLILILALSGCDSSQREGEPSGETPEPAVDAQDILETATPVPGQSAAGSAILANGQLVAAKVPLPLTFKIAGRILDVTVNVGEELSAGQIVATLEDDALTETVTDAELALAQAENAFAQAQLALNNLLTWEPDELAVLVAEANLAAAEARYDQALSVDAAAGNSLTSARVSLNQAERALSEAQENHDNAWDEARDWELNYDEPTCLPGQGGSIPCTGVTWKQRIERDRDFATRALQNAQDGLAVARANFALVQAGLTDDSALEAEAAVANARQVLDRARTGPADNEIEAARLQVAQAELSLQQATHNLDMAQQSLDKAALQAPWAGTVLSVDGIAGAFVTAGMPIITLLDKEALQFHTSNLSERDLGYVEPGQPASITLKTYPAREIDGTVAYVLPQASGQVGDAATFTVVIDIERVETDLLLLPGMTGRVEIRTEGE